MSSSRGSTVEHSDSHSWSICSRGGKANWTGKNIAVMVLGFVLFWPLGLFMVYWIISGRDAGDLPAAARHLWARVTGREDSLPMGSKGGNVVFNEYQQTQYDRIREIKEEIKERARRFNSFRQDAKRRADEEEFNRFMSDAPVRVDN